MNELIRKNLQGRKILLFFILTNIIYLLMLIVTIPGVMNYSGGMKLLDMMPGGYDHEYVSKLLNALGEKGRHAYLFRQLPLDMIYPLLFAITYCLVAAYFLNKSGKLKGPYVVLCYLPMVAGLFDYFENIGIISMLNLYPNLPFSLSRLTSVFSMVKSISTTIFFSLLIILLFIYFIKKIRMIQSGKQ